MKIKPYVDKLEASKEYKEFREEHKDSFLIAGFFVLDFESGKNIHQIDYYVPSQKKVAAFTLDDEVALQLLETMNEKTPQELDLKTKVDLDALKGILEDEMKNRSMTEKINKIIAVIQIVEGEKVWILNCVLSGMEILKAHIEDDSQTVLKMEKASILDYIKKIPGQVGKGPQSKHPQGTSESDVEKKLEELDKIKEALKKEEVELKKKKKEKEDSDDHKVKEK